MYASDDKVGCTPCHGDNNLGVRASRGVKFLLNGQLEISLFMVAQERFKFHHFEKRSVSTETQKRTKKLLVF